MRPNDLVKYDNYKKRVDSRIAEAKSLLENSGYSVLQWQTGEPKQNRPIIAVFWDGTKRLLEYKKEDFRNFVNEFLEDSNKDHYHLDNVKRWAYLPEEQK